MQDKRKKRSHKIIVTCMFLLFTVILTACGESSEKEKKKDLGYKIYYINSEESELVNESYEPVNTETAALISELLDQLEKKPKNLTYKKAKPDTVSWKEHTLKEGQLTLNFDSNYSTMSGISEILCRAAIVKTLCQIDEVDYVEFTVNGQPLMNTNEKPIGFMKKDDFIDNSGGETNYSNAAMTLYFANKEGDKLIEIRINKNNYDGTTPMEQLVIEQLIKGPDAIEGAEEQGLYPSIPKNTQLLKATTKDGVCYVDLNEKFLDKITGVADEVTVYSIVNSLVELSAVNKVKFLINGKEQSTYREKFEFNGFFERDLDIVENNQ